ncbi:MAG: ribonuclease P protein component [Calditrichaeota bacterium]|nr:ribonuclease P protein component [Calditrichota bacterium]
MLKKASDIREVLQSGKKSTGRYLNLFVVRNRPTRFAVLVPRRVGNAVQRNRMKRLVRELYRTRSASFQNQLTIIFIKRFHDKYGDLERDLQQLVAKK